MDSRAQLHGRHAIIIGGGITGLATAMVLGERGAQVTLLERDPVQEVSSPADAFAHWQRHGAPQVRHSHVFLGRLRTLLRDHYPFVLQALLDAGARELRPLDRPPPALKDLAAEPSDEDLVVIGCRRTTFEWVLRHLVLSRYAIDVRSGVVVNGLMAEPGTAPAVTGVRYQNGDGNEHVLRGDFVIDASGRRSVAPQWLSAIGARAVYEKQEPSGIVYYTRFYRLRDGVSEPPPTNDPPAADFNWVKYALFPADERVFSITLAIPLAIQRLKVLAHSGAFDAMVDALPALRPWGDRATSEPIGDPQHPVQAMGGLINRMRRFVDDQGPLAQRFFVLGDAAYCTNPLYGRGCAQGFLHAQFLGEALDAHCDDWHAVAQALDARSRAEIEPYYRSSVMADRDAVRRAEGRPPPDATAELQERFMLDGVIVAMRTDPIVFRAFLRMINMFETPEQAFGHPDVIARTLWVMAQGEDYKRAHALGESPDRETTIARCETAAR